jgi:agmatine deiminase
MRKVCFILSLILCFSFCSIAQPVNPWTPPEFFSSKAVLIEWNFNNNIWPLYSELIDECQSATEVILVVRDQGEENTMRNLLIDDGVVLENISFVHVPCERMWIRDHGPIAINTDTGVAFIDFDDLANSGLDEDLPTNLANNWGLDSYQLEYIFCGGNFMMNSYNTLFTTDRIYTNNPEYSQEEIDSDFETYLGISEIITFSAMHDDYWGHIDMQIKLLDDTTFVISSVDEGSGQNYQILEDNYAILQSLTSPYGTPYRIARLPKADNWKTYANSLLLNNKLLLPIYDHPLDDEAINTYQQLLPEHEIVGINCNSIIGWEGALHCITMQIFDDNIVTAIKDLPKIESSIDIFPNPAVNGSQISVNFSLDEGNAEQIIITDITGKTLEVFSINHFSSPYSFTWDKGAGSFIISIIYNSGYEVSSRFIVTE